MAAEYFIGGVSSMVAEVTTLPFDVIKVRMQLDKGLTFYETCRNLIKEGGITALFIGLQPALLRQVFYGTIRYGLYPPVKKYLSGGHFDYDNLVLNHLLAGCFTGAVAAGISSPTDLVRIRMQAYRKGALPPGPQNTSSHSLENLESNFDSSSSSVHGEHTESRLSFKYHNVFHAFYQIVNEEGLCSLYTCVEVTIVRAAVLTAAELASYDLLKKYLVEMHQFDRDSSLTHILVAAMSSFLAAWSSCPFDTARSRMMNQKKDLKGAGLKYSSLLDCLRKMVYREGGWVVLWSGFFAMFLRLAPHTIITFVIMEKLRFYFSVS